MLEQSRGRERCVGKHRQDTFHANPQPIVMALDYIQHKEPFTIVNIYLIRIKRIN